MVRHWQSRVMVVDGTRGESVVGDSPQQWTGFVEPDECIDEHVRPRGEAHVFGVAFSIWEEQWTVGKALTSNLLW